MSLRKGEPTEARDLEPLHGHAHADRRRKAYSQAQRLLRTYLALANARGGLTIAELIERTGVTRRTISRDLGLLQEDHLVHCPGHDDQGRKRWAILPAGPASGITFTRGELLALYLGRSMLAFARGTELYASMRGAFRKVAERLAAGDLKELDLERKLYALPDAPAVASQSEHYDDVLNEVLTAVLRGEELSLRYPDSDAGGEALQLRVKPLTLAYYRGRLYLLADSAHHGRIRLFALHRVLEADWQRGCRFEAPTDFRPDAYFSSQFGLFHGEEAATVRVRFAPGAARYARERLWHASQRCTDLGDGGCELGWRIPLTPDLRSWLLSFGDAVEVLEPPELRAEVAGALRAAAERYGETPR